MKDQKDIHTDKDIFGAAGYKKQRHIKRYVNQQENNVAGFIFELAPGWDNVPFLLADGIHFVQEDEGDSEVKNDIIHSIVLSLI